MEYLHLTTNGLNDAIRESLAAAIRERNQIEREKLEFEKYVFEFNKQISIDTTKANMDMANTIASIAENFRHIQKSIEVLSRNDAWLKTKIDELDFAVTNLQ